jgi:hypothetical protein
MSDVGDVAKAVTSVADVLRPVIEEAIAEKYDKEHFNYVNEITKDFSTPDALRELTFRLCVTAGRPPATIGDVRVEIGAAELQSLLLIAADAIRDRKYIVRTLAQRGQK